jgi:dihydroorotate dehydrogenase (fumarate)
VGKYLYKLSLPGIGRFCTDLKNIITTFEVNPCILNASGPFCTTRDELIALAQSSSGAIVTKSMTILPRQGNPKPRTVELNKGHIQSIGLANLGYKSYEFIIQDLKQYKKPIIASISGFNLEEYVEMSKFYDKKLDMLELNFSCPNIAGKPLVGYDAQATKEILQAVKNEIKTPLTIKLPPYLNVITQQEIAQVLLEQKVDAVTVLNSPGNTSAIDIRTQRLRMRPRAGGLCGRGIKPIAIGNIMRFHKLFEGKIPIIGVGGIYNGEDIVEHLLAGASVVGIGSAYLKEGPDVFTRLKQELADFLEKHNYNSVKELVGTVKEFE